VRGWLAILLICLGFVAVPTPASAQAADIAITPTIICGTTVINDRYITWHIEEVASRSIAIQDVSISVPSITGGSNFNGVRTVNSWHRSYFGPVTLTVTYLFNDDPDTLMTTSRTAELFPEQCSAEPSVRFETRCDGTMQVYLSNSARAGQTAQFSVQFGTQTSSGWTVSPGNTVMLKFPVDPGTQMLVTAYPNSSWSASWQQADCVGPPPADVPGPPAPGPAPGAGGSGGGQSGGSPDPAATSPEPVPSISASATTTPSSDPPTSTVEAAAPASGRAESAPAPPTVPVIAYVGVAVLGLLVGGLFVWIRRSRASSHPTTGAADTVPDADEPQ
jgi:hypothetical protein